MRRALWFTVAALLIALGAGAQSARPRARNAECDGRERACAAACRGSARGVCVAECGLDARRCTLDHDAAATPRERCRARCAIDSDRCDLSCGAEPDEGARRGCLRRCGSREHIQCPRDCDERFGGRPQ